MNCSICGFPLADTDVQIGTGDGTGQSFAHESCYYQREAKALLQQVDELTVKLHETTLRSADSRDSIIKLRDRVHQLKEQRKFLATKVEELQDELDLAELRRNTETEILHQVVRNITGEILKRDQT